MLALEAVLPQQYWVEINRLLVPFGKHICTGADRAALPARCSICASNEVFRSIARTAMLSTYIAQQSHDSDEVLRIEGRASPSGTPRKKGYPRLQPA